MHRIYCYPDPILKQKSQSINFFDSALEVKLKELISTMKFFKGIGLSAIQIGLPMRIFVVDTAKTGIDVGEFINPEILAFHGTYTIQEGCLSIPGLKSYIKRANKIKVQFQDRFGCIKIREFSGLKAAIIQHETDHLNGILFWDRLTFFKRYYYQMLYRIKNG